MNQNTNVYGHSSGTVTYYMWICSKKVHSNTTALHDNYHSLVCCTELWCPDAMIYDVFPTLLTYSHGGNSCGGCTDNNKCNRCEENIARLSKSFTGPLPLHSGGNNLVSIIFVLAAISRMRCRKK